MSEDKPVDVVLYCPKCSRQHIDAPESEEEYTRRLFESSWWECGGDKPPRWTNPPHKSHLCERCRHVWRPSDHPTNGVPRTASGKDDDTAPDF